MSDPRAISRRVFSFGVLLEISTQMIPIKSPLHGQYRYLKEEIRLT
jgi:hypothetical protein